jgi:hypothetical protein
MTETAVPRRVKAPARPSNVWREGLGWGLGTLVALPVMDAYVRDAPAPQNDELIYARMAEDPFAPHTFPFAYEIR